VITLDTSGLLALIRDTDERHEAAVRLIQQARPPFIVPAGILSEITYMLEHWADTRSLQTFLLDIEEGRYQLDCGDQDFPRIRELVARYFDLPLGFADAAVIACAERQGGWVLTYDRRHFPVVAREGTIEIVG
jgi:predicted nucleic acid-binding protein